MLAFVCGILVGFLMYKFFIAEPAQERLYETNKFLIENIKGLKAVIHSLKELPPKS